eukprot:m.116087 g.116087  ORF g.116087 m.116087 type:complete len:495 (+) comp16369_c0_seq6:553-2037(+)
MQLTLERGHTAQWAVRHRDPRSGTWCCQPKTTTSCLPHRRQRNNPPCSDSGHYPSHRSNSCKRCHYERRSQRTGENCLVLRRAGPALPSLSIATADRSISPIRSAFTTNTLHRSHRRRSSLPSLCEPPLLALLPLRAMVLGCSCAHNAHVDRSQLAQRTTAGRNTGLFVWLVLSVLAVLARTTPAATSDTTVQTDCAMDADPSLTQVLALPAAPARPDGAHKGTFGTVMIIGGTETMIGAPAISATAALRSGVGLCKVMVDKSILPFVLVAQPSATGGMLGASDKETLASLAKADPDAKSVLAVGPGFGQDPARQSLVLALLASGRRMVLDADGLNWLAASKVRLKHDTRASPSAKGLILTPHPGEFRRLAEPLSITENPVVAEERPVAAAKLALAHNAVVVLKGDRTVVTDGSRFYINTSGNPALSTAGSGDVLTGLLASLLAQGMPAFEAAVLGVHVHGRAADEWAAQHGRAGLLAMELAHQLPKALNPLRA